MDGQPVWLASVSLRNEHGIIGTRKWTKGQFRYAEQVAHQILDGVGDSARERCFRMNVTFCIHRAVSEEEKSELPPVWNDASGGLAGGPVEVLWSRGIPHREAAMPCKNPGHAIIDPSRLDLWVPEDCGNCPPCIARMACRVGECS